MKIIQVVIPDYVIVKTDYGNYKVWFGTTLPTPSYEVWDIERDKMVLKTSEDYNTIVRACISAREDNV